MRTNELIGVALDYWVAKLENRVNAHFLTHWEQGHRNYSTDWDLGGPIIEREIVSIDKEDGGKRWAAFAWRSDRDLQKSIGPTPLIAAMRCYVASKLGAEVDVPEELT